MYKRQGLYGENGFDLGEKFRSHAESLGTEFIEGEAVKISKNATDYSIEPVSYTHLLNEGKNYFFVFGA